MKTKTEISAGGIVYRKITKNKKPHYAYATRGKQDTNIFFGTWNLFFGAYKKIYYKFQIFLSLWLNN